MQLIELPLVICEVLPFHKAQLVIEHNTLDSLGAAENHCLSRACLFCNQHWFWMIMKRSSFSWVWQATNW